MEIKYVEGDLFEGLKQDNRRGTIFVPHICNNKGAFGAGFVVPLTKAFPVARSAYIAWHQGRKWHEGHENNEFLVEESGEGFGLGQVQFVEVQHKTEESPRIIVANMIAQTLGGHRPLSYKYLVKCMVHVAQRAWLENALEGEGLHPDEAGCVRIFAPLFGSGLAGGDWNFVQSLIEDIWLRDKNFEVNVYYLKHFLPNNWNPPSNGIHVFNE